MARSLTVEHEEKITTSRLLNGFPLFSVVCLAIAGFVGANAESQASVAVELPR